MTPKPFILQCLNGQASHIAASKTRASSRASSTAITNVKSSACLPSGGTKRIGCGGTAPNFLRLGPIPRSKHWRIPNWSLNTSRPTVSKISAASMCGSLELSMALPTFPGAHVTGMYEQRKCVSRTSSVGGMKAAPRYLWGW
ncbi:MAG TPA: hypothetical protein VGN16_09650 [Acidobacteriaceae bacterium]